MEEYLAAFLQTRGEYVRVYVDFLRYGAPVLAVFLLLRCIKPLLTFRREPEIWAWLCLTDGKKRPHGMGHNINAFMRPRKIRNALLCRFLPLRHGTLGKIAGAPAVARQKRRACRAIFRHKGYQVFKMGRGTHNAVEA